MISSELEARFKKVIAEQLNVEETEVVPSARFTDDLHADSLDLVELLMTLEERFDLEIPDEDMEKLVTVGDALAYIEDRVQTV